MNTDKIYAEAIANEYSSRHSDGNQSVFTKENDKYQWLMLEQKSRCEVEVTQTDRHGKITARDNYEVTGNLPKCVSILTENEVCYSVWIGLGIRIMDKISVHFMTSW